jgi:hypothetical protein
VLNRLEKRHDPWPPLTVEDRRGQVVEGYKAGGLAIHERAPEATRPTIRQAPRSQYLLQGEASVRRRR